MRHRHATVRARGAPTSTHVLGLGMAAVFAACAPATAPPMPIPGEPTVTPVGERPAAAPLPAVPQVDGPLEIDIVYPPEGATIAAVDSTFIFGAVGSGRATLAIDGAPVTVAPNGAFLAFLPVPADGVYRITASRDAERIDIEHRVELTPRPPRTVVGTRIIDGSVYPSGSWTAREQETIEVGFRGTAGGSAALVLPTGERFPLIEDAAIAEVAPGAQFLRDPAAAAAPVPAAPQNVVRYRGTFPARELATPDTAIAPARLGARLPRAAAEARRDSLLERCAGAVAAGRRAVDLPECAPVATSVDSLALLRAVLPAGMGAHVELIVGADTAREPLRLNLATLPENWPRAGVVTFPGEDAVPWDWTARGRNHTFGPFHYYWPHGTRLAITGERDGMYRIHLADGLSAWAPTGDIALLPAGAPVPASLVGSARFSAEPGYIELRVPLAERLPFHVVVEQRTIDLFVYGATSTANFFQYGSLDPLVERAEWRQPADGVFQVRVQLTQPVWGYLPYFDETDALVLRIRRPPVIDPQRPLRGLLVAVDPGHPPGGATGPTRLTEADANLQISLHLRPMLEAAGAQVLMIRSDTSTVPLGDRPRMSTEANAHLFVSVHNNAFPDGVNPFENHGTSTYYNKAHSIDLAQAMQQELLAELPLPDIGIGRADLAVVRQTWVPSVLTESTFMMFPAQEAALRDAGFQQRIARAHVRALERFLRARAAWQH